MFDRCDYLIKIRAKIGLANPALDRVVNFVQLAHVAPSTEVKSFFAWLDYFRPLCQNKIESLSQKFALDNGNAHPTLPSNEIPSSFCASTANSIGSCLSTSRAKPLTINATASSAESPRCIA